MFRGILPLTLSLCLGARQHPPRWPNRQRRSPNRRRTLSQWTPTSIFIPCMSMDITRKQFTNVDAGKESFKGPMNTFVNVPEYPPADFKGVVRLEFRYALFRLPGWT